MPAQYGRYLVGKQEGIKRLREDPLDPQIRKPPPITGLDLRSEENNRNVS